MPVSWFFTPFVKMPTNRGAVVRRYPAIHDFSDQISADGGAWSACECLGNYAVVKVRASQTTLDAIAAAPGIQIIPKSRLDDSLDTLTTTQRRRLRTFLGNLGYTTSELSARFGSGNDLSGVTVGDVLRFALKRRLKPRYDATTDEIILDGPEQPCRPVEDADGDVT